MCWGLEKPFTWYICNMNSSFFCRGKWAFFKPQQQALPHKSVVINMLGAVTLRLYNPMLTVEMIDIFSYLVTRFTFRDVLSSGSYRLAVIFLGVLSAAFLFVVIGLSVHSKYILKCYK